MTPQHHIIRETSETISKLLQEEFKRSGYKRVNIVNQAPRPDAIEGKLPAVSVYLYQISIDPDGVDVNSAHELIQVPQPDGSIKEYMRRRRLWVRLDYLVSAWAQTTEDEQLLMGLAIRTFMEAAALEREFLHGESFEDDFVLYLSMSPRLDEGTLSRFWGSLNQPIRPSVQVWTQVAIIPERLDEFKRVEGRRIAFRDVNNPDGIEEGPEPAESAAGGDAGEADKIPGATIKKRS